MNYQDTTIIIPTFNEEKNIAQLIDKIKKLLPKAKIIVSDDGKGVATSINCKHKTGEDTDKQAGIYFLRTSLIELGEHTFWSIYNAIREIEYTSGF